MRLVSELRRRNVFRMAALYAVAAWLIMQVAEVIIDLAKLPDWIGTTTLWLLAVGFPIALIVSWFYELTPEGLSLEKDVDAAESITRVTGRRLDFIVISLLGAAVILFAYDKWWMSGPPEKSIAVLAFENMSGDPDQEYFSDGISEELLNLLAQIPELTVISRSSAFSFKGKDIAIPTVAEQLNVAHVLEGSVRKVGNRVRITVQLIEARSDSHLWSESYDRELDDIFGVQDEIAMRVVGALKIALLQDMPKSDEINPEAYALYLQAVYLHKQVTVESLQKAIELYERVLAIDSGYAPAWNGLSGVYINQVNKALMPSDDGFALAREAAEKAIELNPDFAPARARLGRIAAYYDGDLKSAAEHFDRALTYGTADTAILADAAAFAQSLGDMDGAIALMEYVVTRDPVNPVNHNNLANAYFLNARFDEAEASYRMLLTLSSGYIGAQYGLGAVMLLQGDAEAAMTAFEQETDEEYRVKGLALAYHALGRWAESEAALEELKGEWGERWPSEVAHVYAYRGEVASAFEWLEKEYEVGGSGGWGEMRLNPLLNSLHNDPRWHAILDKVGVSDEQLATIGFKVSLPE